MEPYKHFIIDPYIGHTYGDVWKDDFQALVDEEFLNSPNIFSILEQDAIGSDSYSEINVRINRGMHVYTGKNMGDDWKLLIFDSTSHPVELGKKYYFENNYWLTFNTELYKNIASSCMVKRCNNVLRWVDTDGILYDEPCIFDNLIARARDQMSSDELILPQGYINVYAQLNEKTMAIKENQRFLVGNEKNRVAYKIFGNGVRNFLNDWTYDDNSARIVMFTMGGNYVNQQTDDIVNGIANMFQSTYEIGNIPEEISGKPGGSFKLEPILLRNNIVIDNAEFKYASSNRNIITVDSSGLISFISNGTASIMVSYDSNTGVTTDIPVIISAIGSETNIIVNPLPTFITEGDTVTYTCHLYTDSILMPDIFTVGASPNNTVPQENYSITQVDGNTFIVHNIKYTPYNKLKILCVSGDISKEIAIELKGRW